MTTNIPSEQLFLRYAIPCAFVLRQRGEIDDATVAFLERAAMGEEPIERAEIERIFFRAFERMDPVAEEMGASRWDPAVIREYFLVRHNKLIEAGEGSYAHAPQTLKDLCRVERATVAGVHGSFYAVTLPNGKTRTVIPPFVPDAQPGDAIIVHYGYAVERAER